MPKDPVITTFWGGLGNVPVDVRIDMVLEVWILVGGTIVVKLEPRDVDVSKLVEIEPSDIDTSELVELGNVVGLEPEFGGGIIVELEPVELVSELDFEGMIVVELEINDTDAFELIELGSIGGLEPEFGGGIIVELELRDTDVPKLPVVKLGRGVGLELE